MKLYTEEQMKKAISMAQRNLFVSIFNSFTQIELPSDEEIEKEFDTHNEKYYIFTEGAKWMKEQILNQNK